MLSKIFPQILKYYRTIDKIGSLIIKVKTEQGSLRLKKIML